MPIYRLAKPAIGGMQKNQQRFTKVHEDEKKQTESLAILDEACVVYFGI